MADHSKIEWTDATWQPITGCSVVSPGCTNCYAMRLAGTRLKHHPTRKGLTHNTKAGPVWNGEVRFNDSMLAYPLRWKGNKRIFVCAHGDLFAEGVPDEWIDRVFAVMALAPQHTFQVLTKRAERMRDWFAERWQGTPAQTLMGVHVEAGGETGRRSQVEEACEPFLETLGLADPDRDDLWTPDGKCKAMQWNWPLPNVWLGVSVEDQQRADERIPLLLDTPAAKRFISAEPLLGPIDLGRLKIAQDPNAALYCDGINGVHFAECPVEGGLEMIGKGEWHSPALPPVHPGLDWVIVGGESGPGARPMHPEWARKLRGDCVEAGVPFHFKQWGEWASAKGYPARLPVGHVFGDGYQMIRVGKKAAGRLLDGRTWDEFPA
jgi:protein gp37